jgi:hypothetical protein
MLKYTIFFRLTERFAHRLRFGCGEARLEPEFASVGCGKPHSSIPGFPIHTPNHLKLCIDLKGALVRDSGGLFTSAQPTLSAGKADRVSPKDGASVLIQKMRWILWRYYFLIPA